jgi:hypothetical protein
LNPGDSSSTAGVPIDWPVNLVTKRIQQRFCALIEGAVTGKEQDPKNGLEKAAVLSQFAEAIRCDYPRSILERWLDFRRETSQDTHKELEETDGFLKEAWGIPDHGILEHDLSLKILKRLLGVSIFRPVSYSDRQDQEAGLRDLDSSLYYASIHHPLLDEQTKARVMETVIVPPGKGSAGAAAQEDFKRGCSCCSFGETVGTVEWQDLAMGQFSFLARRCDADSSVRTGGSSWFIVTVFLPVTCVFEVHKGISIHGFLDIVKESVEGIGGVALVCAGCDAQEDYRTRIWQSTVVQSKRPKSSHLAHAIVSQLVPRSFIKRPGPLNAAAALTRDREGSGYELAALSMSIEQVQAAVKSGLESQAWLTQRGEAQETPHLKGDSLFGLLGGPEDLFVDRSDGCRDSTTAEAGPVSLGGRTGPEPSLKAHLTGDWRDSSPLGRRAAWVLHSMSDLCWPKERLKPVDDVLDAIIGSLNETATEPSEWPGTACGPDAKCTRKSLREVIQYGTYKTKQNLLEELFRLISWPFTSPDERSSSWTMAALRYFMVVACETESEKKANGGAEKTDNPELVRKIDALEKALKKLVDEFSRDKELLGTSAAILLPEFDGLPRSMCPKEEGTSAGLRQGASAGLRQGILARVVGLASSQGQRTGVLTSAECTFLGQPPNTEFSVNWKEPGEDHSLSLHPPDGSAMTTYTFRMEPYCTASFNPDRTDECVDAITAECQGTFEEREILDRLKEWTRLKFYNIPFSEKPYDASEDSLNPGGVLLGSFLDKEVKTNETRLKEHRLIEESFQASLEELAEKEKDARARGAYERSRFLAHSTVQSLDLIWRDPARRSMAKLAQFALWEHRDSILANMGKINHMESVIAKESAWPKLSRVELVDILIDVALSRAFLRTEREPSKALQENAGEKREEHHRMIRRRYGRMNQDERLKQIRINLGINSEYTEDDLGGCRWVNMRCFVHFFTNALWQAAYHALLTYEHHASPGNSGGSRERQYLQIIFDREFVRVANRCIEKEELSLMGSSRDVRYMENLGSELEGTFSIKPDFSKTGFFGFVMEVYRSEGDRSERGK